MRVHNKTFTALALTALVMLGLAMPSQATGNPFLSIELSNLKPVVGDPVVINFSLEGCATFPTSITADFFHDNDSQPFVTFNSSSPGFAKVKVDSNFWAAHWIYKGINSAGVDNRAITVSVSGSGGCIADPNNFGQSQTWIPASEGQKPAAMDFIFDHPIKGGVLVEWTPTISQNERSTYYELQYKRMGTTNWSHSRITRDSSYSFTNLQQNSVYNFRLRVGNRFGVSDWTTDLNIEDSERTPGLFEATVLNSDGDQLPTFDSSSNLHFHIHLENCSHAPTTGDLINYRTAVDAGGYFDANAPHASGSINLSSATYDSVKQTIDAYAAIPTLSAGNYRFSGEYSGEACTWTFSPNTAIVRNRYSNLVQFDINDHQLDAPNWGTYNGRSGQSVTIANQTSTSLVLQWPIPANVEDGPFTYYVSIWNGMTVSKTFPATTENSMLITGLTPQEPVGFKVEASNSAGNNLSIRPTMNYWNIQPYQVVKKGTSFTSASFAKLMNVKVPAGASITMRAMKTAEGAGFTDCTLAKSTIKTAKVLGACSVVLVIQPKKVGRLTPQADLHFFTLLLR